MYRASGAKGWGRTAGGSSITDLYTDMYKEQKAANLARKTEIGGIMDEYISMFQPGGAFGKGFEAQLNLQKVQDTSKTAQSDISRGLYGIRPYEQEWEATVGSTARLKLEDLRMQNLAQALMAKAGFLENINEPYPDLSNLMNATAAGASVPSGGSSGSSFGGLMDFAFGTGGGTAGGTGATLRGLGGTPGEGGYAALLDQASRGQQVIEQKGTSAAGSIQQSVFGKPTNPLADIQNIDVTATGMSPTEKMSPIEAMQKFSTFAEFKAWAESQGLKPGTQAEWKAVKNR